MVDKPSARGYRANMVTDLPPAARVSAVDTTRGAERLRERQGLMQAATPEQTTAAMAEQPPASAPIDEVSESSLIAHCTRIFHRAQQNKVEILKIMLEDLRMRNAEYDPEDLQTLNEQGHPIIYMRLAANKARAAIAWINDIMFQGDDKPWGIEPTPIADIPPDVVDALKQQAVMDVLKLMMSMPAGQPIPIEAIKMHGKRLREMVDKKINQIAIDSAGGMERLIADQYDECQFNDTIKKVVEDLVTFPNAFIAGPEIRRKKKLKWASTRYGWRPNITWEITTTYDWVSPFDIFVTNETNSCQEGPIFRRRRMTRAALIECKGQDGYIDDAIEEVLSDYYAKGTRLWMDGDQERYDAEFRDNLDVSSDNIEVCDGWLTASGRHLSEMGVYNGPFGPISESVEYDVNVWWIKNKIIYFHINDHPDGQRPISSDSYERINGSFWGRSLIRACRDKQKICNASARSIVRNMEFSSGDQVAIDDINRVPAGEKVNEQFVGKVWQFTNERGSTNPPLYRFSQDSHVQELLAVYNKFASELDNDTGIPAYAYGDDQVAGAGKTLGGLSILSNNAARGLRLVMSNMDKLIRECVTRQYIHNMLYSDDESVKGDCKVVARGAMTLVTKETATQRRINFLAVTNNPVDISIMGIPGRATVLREVAKTLDIASDDVVPPDSTIRQMLASAPSPGVKEPQKETPAKEKPA